MRSHALCSRIQEQVVVTGDDQVGDLIHLPHRFLRLLDVLRIRKDLTRQEVIQRCHGVSGNQQGGQRRGNEQPAGAGRVSGQWE